MLRSRGDTIHTYSVLMAMFERVYRVYRLPSFQPRQLIDGNKGEKHKCLNKVNKPLTFLK